MSETIVKVESSVPCSHCIENDNVEKGWMLPLFDYTQDNTIVYIKGYICSHCGHNFIFKSGEIIQKQVLTDTPKGQP